MNHGYNYKPDMIPIYWFNHYDLFFPSIAQESIEVLEKIEQRVKEDFSSMHDIVQHVIINKKLIERADYTNSVLFRILAEKLVQKFGAIDSFDLAVWVGNDIVHFARNQYKLVRGKHHIITMDYHEGKRITDKLYRVTVTFGLQGIERYMVRASSKKRAIQRLKNVMPSHHQKRKATKIETQVIQETTVAELLGEL